MRNTYVVRLSGDSSGLENALNQARQSINNLGNEASKLKDIQDKFEDIQKPTVPLKRKIRDIKKAMEQMVLSGENTTAEGKEMWEKLSEAAKQYDEMLRQIQRDTSSVGDASNDVAKKGGISKVDAKGIGKDLMSDMGLGSLTPALDAVGGAINPVALGITALGTTMVMAGKSAAQFEQNLNSLQALTGLGDGEMKAINDGAIEMSKNFKSSAGEIVDAMKLIGSQAPELLKDKDALMEVTKAANVLSEAAEISVEDSAKAITGVMNQMGASASESASIINTLAAASQQGSADVAYLNKAFEKSGTAASSAGMDYVELASMIESIAPKFSSADVAGSQLASTLLKLSMSGNSDLMPSVVGMSKALENLAKAEMDDVTMKNLVGESNITMLKSLIEAREQFNSYSQSLRGTNTAYEQMETNSKGVIGAIDKLKSQWEAFLLVLGQSGIMDMLVDNLMGVMSLISELFSAIGDVIKAFDDFGTEGIESTNSVKETVNILCEAIKGIGTVLTIIVKLFAKAFNEIKGTVESVKNYIGDKWDELKKKLGDVAFVRVIIKAFNKVLDAAANMVNQIKKFWNKLKEFLGMKVEGNVDIKATHSDDKVDGSNNKPVNIPSSTPTSSKGKPKGGSKSSKTGKIDYLVSLDDNSLETAEKKLSAWTSKKKSLNIDDKEAIARCDEQIKQWQDEVQKRKIILEGGIGVELYDSLSALQSQLNELENHKRELEIRINSNTDIESINSQIDSLEDKNINLSVGISSNAEEIDKIHNGIDSLEDKNINLSVGISSNAEEIDSIDRQINDIKNKILIDTIRLGIKPEIEKGSKTDIENQIKSLEDVKKVLFQTNADPSTIRQVDDEIKSLKNKLESEEIRLGIKPFVEVGSLNDIKKRIKEKEAEISLALNTNINPESLKKLQSDLERLRKEQEAKEIEMGIKVNTPTIHKEDRKFERGTIEDKKQSLSNAQSMVSEIQENYKLNLIGKDEVESQLKDINDKLEDLGFKPITLTFNDDGTLTTAIEDLERLKNNMASTSDIVGSMGSVFTSLGGAIEGSTGQLINFAGQSLNAISQIIPQIATLIAAKQSEAMASGTASAASLPFPANIAAMASIIATVASLFASIPKFESGGVVGGNSYTGDKLLARVNSGELILNKTQQKNLYNSLEKADVGNNTSTLKGDVNFTISGSNLKGALRNYEQKMSRIK